MSAHQIKNYIFLILLSLIAIWLFQESRSFGSLLGEMESTYGPEFFPQVLLGLMLFLCVIIAVETRKLGTKKVEPLSFSRALRVFFIVVLCGAFALAWEKIGFLIAAYVFAALCCAVLKTSWKGVIAIALFIPASWLFFTKVLMVSL